MIEIELLLFGRFRRLSAERSHRIFCDPGVTVADIRRLVGEEWRHEDSVADAVLATEDRVLRDEEQIFETVRLALLPPVCGG